MTAEVFRPYVRRLVRRTSATAIAIGLGTAPGRAAPVTLTFSGEQLTIVGEYVNGVPAQPALFAPLFNPASAQTITVSVSYDTDQPLRDLGHGIRAYLRGAISIEIPALSLIASSRDPCPAPGRFVRPADGQGGCTVVQISPFLTPRNHQFFVGANAGDYTFSNAVGLPDHPTSFGAIFFGRTSMLANDALPENAFDWRSGNVSFNFINSGDGPSHQVLLSFDPKR